MAKVWTYQGRTSRLRKDIGAMNITQPTDVPKIALRGCDIILVEDGLDQHRYVALVPNGYPLVWEDKEWVLPNPLIVSLILKAARCP
jgi:hypothetical protein